MADHQKKLNPHQLEAVEHGDGPLLIIAGAGTGKTAVITERIKWLIQTGKAQPGEVLALTFTEKAAREMQERVDIAMPYGYTQMWISTFHSFCDRVLKLDAIHIGLDPNYRLMTQSEAIQFFRQNIFKFDLKYFRPLGNPNKFIGGLLQHFSRLKDEDIVAETYQGWIKQKLNSPANSTGDGKQLEIQQYEELARLFREYDLLKAKGSVMDFSDLITNTLQLFRERPNILQLYQKRFKYILVDEFQDTNFAQNQLVVLLSGNQKNLTVVADDDQGIYRFRGAAISNVIQFRQTFPMAKIITLVENYRSTQIILDSSYKLIQNNNPDRLEVKEHIDKKLIAARVKTGQPVSWIHRDRVENEADSVAQEILRLTANSQQPTASTNTTPKAVSRQSSAVSYQYQDIAILVRANSHAEAFSRALSRHNIPFQFLGPGQLFRQDEIKDLIAYLKLLDNPEDNISLYRVLCMSVFDISSRDIVTLTTFTKKFGVSLFDACEYAADVSVSLKERNMIPPFITARTKESLTNLINIIHRHMTLLPTQTAGQILYFFMTDSNLLQKIINPDTPKAEIIAQNITKLFDKLKSYEGQHTDSSVRAVVDWIDLSMDLGESPLAADFDWSGNNAVSILTVHSSKGLEFPVVFLVNLVSQRFPTIERREQIPIPDELVKEILPEGDYHLEEERRLFYVGMTRARDLLYLTSADYYGEGKREKKTSQFIFEALGQEIKPLPIAQELPQLSLLEWGTESSKTTIEKLPPLKVTYLSYSQIDTFELCPLHYKLKYLLKIDTPPSAAQSMGTSIHKALHDFYYLRMLGEKVSETDLLNALKTNWVPEGYTSKIHQENSYQRVTNFLKNYYQTQYSEEQRPVKLEETFTLPVAGIKIGGKIDRVDDLGKDTIEIIDYKSGSKIPDQKVIDKNLQMTLYAMAASRIPSSPFGKNPEQVKLSFYYFEEGKKITTTRTEKDFTAVEEKISDIVHQIESSDFKCSGSPFCLACEYKMLCSPGQTSGES